MTSGPDKVFPSVASRSGKLVISYYTRDYAYGDYTQVAVGTNGVAHASWTDFRGRSCGSALSFLQVCARGS